MSGRSSYSGDTKCDEVEPRARHCTKKHRAKFLECEMGVVYVLPFTCGKCYIGQTEKCINERLRQHQYNFFRARSEGRSGGDGGALARHCLDCGCEPDFYSCQLISKGADKKARDIVEALEVQKAGTRCITRQFSVVSKIKTDMLTDSDSESGCSVQTSEPVPESVSEIVSEPTSDPVSEPVAESQLSGRAADFLAEHLLRDFPSVSTARFARLQRLMTIMDILEHLR